MTTALGLYLVEIRHDDGHTAELVVVDAHDESEALVRAELTRMLPAYWRGVEAVPITSEEAQEFMKEINS